MSFGVEISPPNSSEINPGNKLSITIHEGLLYTYEDYRTTIE